MERSNKLLWIVCGGVVVLGVVFSIFRIVMINKQYPQTVEKNVAEGTEYEMGSGISMSVLSSRWLNGEELQKEYDGVWYEDNPMDYQGVEVTVNICNSSKKTQKVELFKTYIESEKYDWNGCDADLFMAKNNMPLEVEIKAGEKLSCVLPYTFLKENYLENDWGHLSRNSYFLVRNRYPQKTKWMIS